MSIVLVILGKLSGLFLIVILGVILYKRKILTDQNLPGISALITGVALPSVILNSFQIPFSLDLLAQGGLFCLLYVVLSLVGIVLGIVTSRLLGVEGEQKKVWLFCCSLTNTAFLGTAVANALFTQAEMAMVPFALIISNLMMFTVGPIVLAGQKNFSGRQFARLILNPGNICFVIGLVLFLLSVSLPSAIAQAVSMTSNLTTPLALLVTGAALARCKLKQTLKNWRLYILAAVRLLILPALACLILKGRLDPVLLRSVVYMSALSAPATTTAMVGRYGGDGSMAAEATFISTVLAVATIPLLSILFS